MSNLKPSLRGVLSDTSRIISANSHHFFALLVLFLFPISLTSTIYTLLFQPTSLHSHYSQFLSSFSTPDSELPPVGKSHFLISVLYFLITFILSLCAVPSITYSTFHGFYGKPGKFASSLESIRVSFFPLLATKLVTTAIIGLAVFGIGLFMLLPYAALASLGFKVDYSSIYFLVLVILMAVLFVGLLIFVGIEWSLTTAIVIVESQWGFAPLKRSSYLVKGMKWVVFRMIVFFGILSGLLSMLSPNVKANHAGNISKGCGGWVVVQVVGYAALSSVLSLYSLVAQTVLLVHCKAFHGESGVQIDGKLGAEYVRLPFDAV